MSATELSRLVEIQVLLLIGNTYVALQSAHLELLERLPGLIAVADILESLGGVLAADVEKDLLTTAV